MQEEIRPLYNTRLHCSGNNSYVSVNYIYDGGTASVTRSGLSGRFTSSHHIHRGGLVILKSLTLATTHARERFLSFWTAVQTDVHTDHPCTANTAHCYR